MRNARRFISSRIPSGAVLAVGAACLGLFSATAAPAQQVTRTGEASAAISSLVTVQPGARIAFVSGMTAPSPARGEPVAGDTEAQTKAVLARMDELLKSQGMSLADVVMMRVYLVGDPAKGGKMDFAGMMAGYRQFFGTAAQPNKPSRTTVQVSALASPGALVEIEAQVVRAP